MKSFLFRFVCIVGCIFVTPLLVTAAAVDAPATTDTGAAMSGEALLLDTITVQDDANIRLSFNQDIVPDAVRVTISKQSNGSDVQVNKIVSIPDSPKSVMISMKDLLEENSTYTLTAVSAISQGGVVIKEGADAIKEFTTPSSLKKSAIVFNAPSNPNAVVAATGASNTNQEVSATATGTKETVSTVNATELPLTGINTTVLLILAGLFAFLLVFRRHRI